MADVSEVASVGEKLAEVSVGDAGTAAETKDVGANNEGFFSFGDGDGSGLAVPGSTVARYVSAQCYSARWLSQDHLF
jgi:hypothetical protein